MRLYDCSMHEQKFLQSFLTLTVLSGIYHFHLHIILKLVDIGLERGGLPQCSLYCRIFRILCNELHSRRRTQQDLLIH